MNQVTLTLILQPVLTPVLTALLSDPRPGRVWIKVSVVFLLTVLATWLQLQGKEITPEVFSQGFLQTLLYNQGIHRLFKHSFDKLENVTGNGAGIVADALGRSLSKPTNDPWSAPSVVGEYPED